MRAFRHPVRFVLFAVMLAFIVGVTPAYAAYTVIPQPDAAYKAGTTKIDVSGLTITQEYTSISDGVQTVSFSQPIGLYDVPGFYTGPFYWGTLPWVEQEADVRYFGPTEGATLTLSLAEPVKTFGIEVSNNEYATYPYTVTFRVSSDGTPVGQVQQSVTVDVENFNARLFAITSDTAFDQIDIVTSGSNGFGFAQTRYSFSSLEPAEAVSTPASSPWSLMLLAGLAVGAAVVIRRRYA